jgi:hypothetical protein
MQDIVTLMSYQLYISYIKKQQPKNQQKKNNNNVNIVRTSKASSGEGHIVYYTQVLL